MEASENVVAEESDGTPTWTMRADKVIHAWILTADLQKEMGDAAVIAHGGGSEPQLLVDGEIRGYVVGIVQEVGEAATIFYHREREPIA